MTDVRHPDWRQWLAAARHPARKDGAVAVALFVLPWVIALALELLHRLGDTTVTILASASVGLPTVWLAWVPVRNADRTSTPSGDRAPGITVLAGSAGRPLAEVTDPFALEVHRPVQLDYPPPGLPDLPAYVPRDHDTKLGSVVRAAAAGRSGIAVLVGGSSTGKTRACWEALQLLRHQQEQWRLWHPIDPTRPDAALRELPGIGPRTVVWLNEAQFYLDVIEGGLGERVAAGLRELLRNPARAPVLVLATLWPQFWDTLTARPPGADTHAQARELLAGHDITVPTAFAQAQLDQLGLAADTRLTLAAAGAQDGQVIQFLAGAPELLARYRNAPPAAAALIDAAMDARRLGMRAGLPQGFLDAAAPGYLTDAEWDTLGESWEKVLQGAWDYTAVPSRGIAGPLTRIPPARRGMAQPSKPGSAHTDDHPPTGRAGITSGLRYRLADYLDQHGRAHREDRIPPAEFWAAAAVEARPGDQTALGSAADDRGLYRAAAQLHKNAAASGSLRAAFYLSDPPSCLRGDARPASWAAAHVSLESAVGLAGLLGRLREAGAQEQVAVLLRRDPAAHVSLDSPYGVAELLNAMREAGAQDQVAVLLRRNPAAHVSLDSPYGVAELLNAMREAGAQDQASALAARSAAHVSLDSPHDLASLVRALREAGAQNQASALAARAAARVSLDDPGGVAGLLACLREAGAQDQVPALLRRDPAAHVSLDSLYGLAELLDALCGAGAQDQASALAARSAAHVSLDSPYGLASLVRALREASAQNQASALLRRDPATLVSLDDPGGVAELMNALRKAGAQDQVPALLRRDPAAHVSLDSPYGVADLLEALGEAGAQDQVSALLRRDPAVHVSLDYPGGVAELLYALREADAQEQVSALAARAARVSLDRPSGVAWLLRALREAGTQEQADALTARLPTAGMFRLFLEQQDRADQFHFGRETDGNPSAPWSWEDLDLRSTRMALLVIDHYADLDPDGRRYGRPRSRPVRVSVTVAAKSAFRTATHAIRVLRGASARQLYVTAAGMIRADAADLVGHMAEPVPDTRCPAQRRHPSHAPASPSPSRH